MIEVIDMVKDVIDFLTALIIGFAAYFFGGLDGFMQVLIILVVVDYISGVIAAGMQHEISSSTGFTGIARKVFIFALVGISHVLDQQFLNNSATLRTAVCMFYIGNEGISILENADKLGIPLPKILMKNFRQFRQEQEHHDDGKSLPSDHSA